MEDSDSEWFHNVIVNIFDIVLEESTTFLSNAINQLEPNIFLKVKAYVHTQVHIP